MHPLARYFEDVLSAFQSATERHGVSLDLRLDLAGRPIRFRTAGPLLPPSIPEAFRHLQPASSGPWSLDVVAWDHASTGIPIPPPPWSLPELPAGTRLRLGPDDARLRIAGTTAAEGVHLFEPETGRAVWFLPDASRIPTFHYSLPFLTLFKWWAPLAGLQLLHAGCVATPEGGALIVGPGGAGKSTTSLLCALHGFHYLSDDICLAQLQPQPRAFSLYNSGKLHRLHIQHFPELARHAIDPVPDPQEKPVYFVHAHHPDRTRRECPLRAILCPFVTGKPDTSSHPITPGEALRALAPSTLVQLSPDNLKRFHDLAALTRKLPAFRLNLGTRTDEIAPHVTRLLQSLP